MPKEVFDRTHEPLPRRIEYALILATDPANARPRRQLSPRAAILIGGALVFLVLLNLLLLHNNQAFCVRRGVRPASHGRRREGRRRSFAQQSISIDTRNRDIRCPSFA